MPDTWNRFADLHRVMAELETRCRDLPASVLTTWGISMHVEPVRPGQPVPEGAIGIEHAAACARWHCEQCSCDPRVRTA